jgi:hypothetical protein
MANIWTDDETKLLITIWRDQNIQQQLENHSIRNKIVYEKLAKGMAASTEMQSNASRRSSI